MFHVVRDGVVRPIGQQRRWNRQYETGTGGEEQAMSVPLDKSSAGMTPSEGETSARFLLFVRPIGLARRLSLQDSVFV
jgi:hypothetical protein